MALEQTVAPTVEPVSLAELKAHCRVDHSALDSPLQAYLDAAVRFVQEYTGVQLCSATYAYYLDGWDQASYQHNLSVDCGAGNGLDIWLPKPPLGSVSSVAYYDQDNASQTLSSSYYVVDAKSLPGRIRLASNYTWPVVYDRPNAITITYTAGYASAALVPATYKHAIKLAASHWFENAEAVNVGNIVNEVPFSLKALLNMESTGLVL